MANEAYGGVSRFGTKYGGTAGFEQELFLKVYAQEVLLAFEREAVTNGLVRTRSISHGRSAQFPLVGAMRAGYHVPGHNIITEGGTTPTYLSRPNLSEKEIFIDGFLQSSCLIPDIDEAMSHYDVRGPFAREMGWALAKEYDINTLRTIVNGARKAETITYDLSDWGKGGAIVTEADFESDIADIRAAIKSLAQQFDERDVPKRGRHLAVTPATYHLLADEDDYVSTDFNRNTGGDRGTAMIVRAHGFLIHETNRIADLIALGDVDSAGLLHSEQYGTDYLGDFSTVLGVAWQQEQSVGVVKLKQYKLRADFKSEYNATFMVGGFSVGHGVLHEAACGVVQSA